MIRYLTLIIMMIVFSEQASANCMTFKPGSNYNACVVSCNNAQCNNTYNIGNKQCTSYCRGRFGSMWKHSKTAPKKAAPQNMPNMPAFRFPN